MLAAYFDDAGTHDQGGVAVIAGYVGSVEEWEILGEEWDALLRREGIPFYHAVDSAHARGHFSGRGRGDCNRVHREAVEIITRRKILGLGAGLHLSNFRRMYAGLIPPGGRQAARPEYYTAFDEVLRICARYGAEMEDQVSIVMEETHQVQGRLVDTYEHLVTTKLRDFRRHLAGPPTFSPKLGYPQLQAADVWAYEVALNLRRQFIPPLVRGTRASFVALGNHAVRMAENRFPPFWYRPYEPRGK